jgi:hypothetical protein
MRDEVDEAAGQNFFRGVFERNSALFLEQGIFFFIPADHGFTVLLLQYNINRYMMA